MLHHHKRLRCATLLLVLAMDVPIRAEAQEVASSLDQLRQLLRVGDNVIVTDRQGRQTQGSIAEISSSSLGLTVGGTRADFSERDLDTVSRRDSRWNGALWGLAIGSVLGIALERSVADEYGRDDVGYGSLVVPLGGLGAGIGFALDAMIKGRRILYTGAGSATKSTKVAPVWTDRSKGIVVSLQF